MAAGGHIGVFNPISVAFWGLLHVPPMAVRLFWGWAVLGPQWPPRKKFGQHTNIVIMVPPPSQRGIGSFFRKESDLNDEEWEDCIDRLYEQSEE